MFVLPSLVVLDIVLNNTKKKKLKKNRALLQQLKTGHLGRERFVIFLTTQVPDMLRKYTKTCKSSVST
jgi:hypothetical protein